MIEDLVGSGTGNRSGRSINFGGDRLEGTDFGNGRSLGGAGRGFRILGILSLAGHGSESFGFISEGKVDIKGDFTAAAEVIGTAGIKATSGITVAEGVEGNTED